jgi:hypothetical protein
MIRLKHAAMAMSCAAALAGCAPSTEAVLETSQSAVALRSFQQRAFDTTDMEKTLRTVIATLQDLSFVVDKADLDLGTVSATKLSGYQVRITVTVRPRGNTQLLVRANAQYMDKAIEDPKPYQDFFVALEKSMFLTAQQVD